MGGRIYCSDNTAPFRDSTDHAGGTTCICRYTYIHTYIYIYIRPPPRHDPTEPASCKQWIIAVEIFTGCEVIASFKLPQNSQNQLWHSTPHRCQDFENFGQIRSLPVFSHFKLCNLGEMRSCPHFGNFGCENIGRDPISPRILKPERNSCAMYYFCLFVLWCFAVAYASASVC